MLALAMVAVAGLPAEGHATLVKAVPGPGSVLDSSPDKVLLEFNEPVQPRFGGIRVFDAELNRVDRGYARNVAPKKIQVPTKNLTDGSYSVAWKVISADSHPVQGAFTFVVGETSAAMGTGLENALDTFGEVRPSVKVAASIARFLGYATSLILVGVSLFVMVSWRTGGVSGTANEHMSARSHHLLRPTWATAAFATVLLLATQAATESGRSLVAGFTPAVFGPVVDSNFGRVWLVRMALVLALLPLLKLAFKPASGAARRPALRLMVAGSSVVAITPAFWGHSNAADDRVLAIASDSVHVLAMAAWVGGLAALVLLVPKVLEQAAPSERAGTLASTVPRFSAMAIICVALLTATGTYLSVIHVQSWSNLFGSTYGQLIVAKIAGLVLALTLGGYNLLRTRRELQRFADSPDESDTWAAKLRTAVKGELLVTGIVLAVAAVLVSISPPGPYASAPETFVADAKLGEGLVAVTLSPARVGTAEVHATILDSSGAPDAAITDPKVIFTQVEQSLGPFQYRGTMLRAGHFVVTNVTLPVPGKWQMHMVVTQAKFNSLEHTFNFEVGG